MSRRVDIKDAFRQIPVDPLHAAKHGDVSSEYVVVDLFRQFEGRCLGFSDQSYRLVRSRYVFFSCRRIISHGRIYAEQKERIGGQILLNVKTIS